MIHLIHTTPKAAGYGIITNEFGMSEAYDTVCCVHCRRHWKVEPGSGRKRGWCSHCKGITCGTKACDNCTPFLEAIYACS